jgi:hypothetical protein
VASLLKKLAHNWKLKVLAFALSLLLWVAVSADQVTTRTFRIPLEVDVQDDNWTLVATDAPTTVEVRLFGPVRELVDLAFDPPRIVLRVGRVDTSSQTFALEPGMVRIPRAFSVSAHDVRPERVRLHFERVGERDVPVRVQVSREPRAPYQLADLNIAPATITIRGPNTALARVDTLRTEPIDLSREDALFQRQVSVQSPGIPNVRLDTETVVVTGQVDREVERVIDAVPIAVPPGVRLAPATVEMRLEGLRSVITAITQADLGVAIAADTLPARIPDTGVVLPLRIERLPRGVRGEIVPDTVRAFPNAPAADTLPSRPADPPPGDDGARR